MLLHFIIDAGKLALIGVLTFFLLRRYLRWKKPNLAEEVERHRLLLMLVLSAVLIGIKITDDVLGGESGPVDKSILLFIHRSVPTGLTGFFETVTLLGSFDVMLGLLVISSLLLIAFKRWFEAVLLVNSAIVGALVIYFVKLLTGRERPALWETRWYWGTSFPSGHTLETACVAMSLTLSLGRLWPKQARLLRLLAWVWVLLVGLSRLVLGVHWPTDVLAAMCIGMLIPVALQFLFIRQLRRQKT